MAHDLMIMTQCYIGGDRTFLDLYHSREHDGNALARVVGVYMQFEIAPQQRSGVASTLSDNSWIDEWTETWLMKEIYLVPNSIVSWVVQGDDIEVYFTSWSQTYS